jgi:hypothetical protein
MNVRYRVELNQSERDQLITLLSLAAASTRFAGSSGRSFYWRPTPGPATRRSQGASAWAAPPRSGPSAASSSAIWRPH